MDLDDMPLAKLAAVKKEQQPIKQEEDDDDMPISSRRKARNQQAKSAATVKKEEDAEEGKKKEATTKTTTKRAAAAAANGKTSSARQTKKKDNDVKMEEDSDEEDKKKAKKGAAKATTAKSKGTKRKKEESDDEGEEDKKSTPKKRVKKEADPDKEKKAQERKVKKDQKEKEKQEEEANRYKWWKEDKNTDDKIKWTFLEHRGVLFPPEYQPHGIKVRYKGKPVDLTSEQEEAATMFAVMRETAYYTKPIFRKNFWSCWEKLLNPSGAKTKHVIKDLDGCDFTAIWDWYCAQKDEKKNKSKEEKQREKEEKAKIEEPYKYATVNGRKEKVGNFRVEPPGLFRGRGEHPKQGIIKPRIRPEDVTINCSKDARVPPAPKGHKWGSIVHNNEVTWIAMYKQDQETKYVFLAASSSFKGKSDWKKFETAKNLGVHYIDPMQREIIIQ